MENWISEKLIKINAAHKLGHFEREIVVRCVNWYLEGNLSYPIFVEHITKRGVIMSHPTILHWVRHFEADFEKLENGINLPKVSDKLDELYVKIFGHWVYLYRALTAEGNPVDFRLSYERDLAAAKNLLSIASHPYKTKMR